jgi:hypothetical protein
MFETLKKYFSKSKKEQPKPKENSLEKMLLEIKKHSLPAELEFKKIYGPLKVGAIYNIFYCPRLRMYIPTPEPKNISKAAMFIEENIAYPNLVFYNLENNEYLKYSWNNVDELTIFEIK